MALLTIIRQVFHVPSTRVWGCGSTSGWPRDQADGV